MSLLADLREDAHALGEGTFSALMGRGWQALALYRLARRAYLRGIPILPMLLTRVAQILYGIDIDWRAIIEPGVVIRHGVGTVIGSGTTVGAGTTIFHGVTLGYGGTPGEDGTPKVGRNVLIGAGAVLLGRIPIGDDAKVGANAVVLRDVPAGATVVGNPGRIVKGECSGS